MALESRAAPHGLSRVSLSSSAIARSLPAHAVTTFPHVPFPHLASGKVREIFDLGEHLLLVATDRISAFDCILPNAIPEKGRVLNTLSAHWFERFGFVENHVVTTDFAEFPSSLAGFRAQLEGRSMVVRKAKPLPVARPRMRSPVPL